MHERLLARAALPAQVRVLGVPLRPYSLGHELYLLREQSPLLEEFGEVSPDDLVKAIFFCSNSWSQNQQINSDWLTGIKLSILKFRVRPFNFDHAVATMRLYLRAGLLGFPSSTVVRSGETEVRLLGTPPILRLNQFLQMKLRKTEEQAWDYPYGLACMHWQAYMETENGVSVYNEAESSLQAYAAEQDALAAQEVEHA